MRPSAKVLDLDGVASAIKNATMIMVTLLCGPAVGSAGRIWVKFSILVWRILGQFPPNFSANFPANYLALFFFRASGPPPRKIHAPNCRHSFNFRFFELNICFTPIVCLQERSRNLPLFPVFSCICSWEMQGHVFTRGGWIMVHDWTLCRDD